MFGLLDSDWFQVNRWLCHQIGLLAKPLLNLPPDYKQNLTWITLTVGVSCIYPLSRNAKLISSPHVYNLNYLNSCYWPLQSYNRHLLSVESCQSGNNFTNIDILRYTRNKKHVVLFRENSFMPKKLWWAQPLFHSSITQVSWAMTISYFQTTYRPQFQILTSHRT